MSEKNPYETDSPEWQLFENATSLEKQALAADADSERYMKVAVERRAKAQRYRDALEKLTS